MENNTKRNVWISKIKPIKIETHTESEFLTILYVGPAEIYQDYNDYYNEKIILIDKYVIIFPVDAQFFITRNGLVRHKDKFDAGEGVSFSEEEIKYYFTMEDLDEY